MAYRKEYRKISEAGEFVTFEYKPSAVVTKAIRIEARLIEHQIQFENLLVEAGYKKVVTFGMAQQNLFPENSNQQRSEPVSQPTEKWVEYLGHIRRETDKAVLLDGELGWVPKKAIRTAGDRIQVARWIMNVKANVLAKTGSHKTKKELVEEASKKIEEKAGRVLRFDSESEPKFYGSVDKVLDKILN